MIHTDGYHWNRLTSREQVSLLKVQNADSGEVELAILNDLAGYGLLEWLKGITCARPILTQRGARALAYWRYAS